MKAMFERYVAQEDFDYRIRLNYWEDEQYCSKHTKSFDFFKNIQNEFEFGKTPNIINKWINELSSLGYAISSKFQWQEHLDHLIKEEFDYIFELPLFKDFVKIANIIDDECEEQREIK